MFFARKDEPRVVFVARAIHGNSIRPNPAKYRKRCQLMSDVKGELHTSRAILRMWKLVDGYGFREGQKGAISAGIQILVSPLQNSVRAKARTLRRDVALIRYRAVGAPEFTGSSKSTLQK